jgi:hypothetical protein
LVFFAFYLLCFFATLREIPLPVSDARAPKVAALAPRSPGLAFLRLGGSPLRPSRPQRDIRGIMGYWEQQEESPSSPSPFAEGEEADRVPAEPLEVDIVYECQHCGQENVVTLDASAGDRQDFVEDCAVCCGPNHIKARLHGNGEVDLEVESGHE